MNTAYERALEREAARASLPFQARQWPIEAEHQAYPNDRGAIAAGYVVVALGCGPVWMLIGWVARGWFG